jgi:hypothetical protein
MKYLLILLLFSCSAKEYPEPTKEPNLFLGRWESKSVDYPIYIFEDNGTGKQYTIGHWYDITYEYKSQKLSITWMSRTSTYYVYDQSKTYFKLCNGDCVDYFKK